MAQPVPAPAALKLDAFVRQYRSTVLVRFLLTLGLTVMLATVAPLGYALFFGLTHLALYGLFYGVVEAAARGPGAAAARLEALTWRTALVTALLTLHVCWIALQVRAAADSPVIRMEAGLAIIGMLMFVATQAHMSRFGYLLGVAPAVGSLLWLTINQQAGANPHFLAVVCLFVVGVVAMTWRQLSTDLILRDTKLALEEKNLELGRLVSEAEAARLQAETANRAKSDFLAMTSHEIRTPLNAVLGLAEALHRSRLAEPQAGMARGVVEAGALLKRLLDSMLDISRIEAGRMALSLAPFDLRHAVETLAFTWAPRAEENGLRLELDLADLPAPCGLLADGPKVEQMLFNLVSNAVKFSPPGGVVVIRAALEPGLEGGPATVRLEVADQGPGVSPEDSARIFEAFEQADGGRALGGAGLGLAICAGNLALMGGTITVETAPGGGALFRIAFSSQTCALPAPKPEAEPIAALDDGRRLRVLAAEDNAGNRHVLQVLLEALPVDLTLVVDGAQAVEAMAGQPFDMVLMDANMPVMDGLTALRTIRAAGSATPVWMLTANVFEEDVSRYRAAGADGVICKPIALDELFAALAQAATQNAAPGGAAASDAA
ncbi:ATP-binding protein [Caulobacter mirabilis]|nr:ATP-binding protein [Caulobacter mirabilis]